MIDATILDRHKRIALAFSGGKDSLAVAHLLRPFWDRLMFYHLDAGDLLPEMVDVVTETEKMVPHFRRVVSNSREWGRANGWPSDLVPFTGTFSGVMMGGTAVSGRYDCCGNNLWLPMHNRMIDDEVTLVIRGSKRVDMKRLPAEGGPVNGYELWLPILEWSHGDVFDYLKSLGVSLPRIYDHVVNAPECATCPAWLDEHRASYLRSHYPALFAEYAAKVDVVAGEVLPVVARLQYELRAIRGSNDAR